MNALNKKYLRATVKVPYTISLAEMASRLGSVIDGVVFEEDDTGRYEEVPAFVAKDAGSATSFILFGIPEGEHSDVYILEFSADTELAIEAFRKTTCRFLSEIICEKPINSKGFFDYSEELANALTMRGIGARGIRVPK